VRLIVVVVAGCVIDGLLQVVCVLGVKVMRQVTLGGYTMQVIDMNVGYVADSYPATMLKPSMTGVVGVNVVTLSVMDGTLHMRRVVVGDNGHGHVAIMVRVA